MISKDQVANILEIVDIVDVIDSRIKLKRIGSNYKACCPFHEETTPSFTINQPKQFYYCFGCGAGGDAIKFLREYENQSFVEAVKELARMAGVSIDETKPDKPIMPKRLREEIDLDRYFLAIYNADKDNGKTIHYKDKERARLAQARIQGVQNKYGESK